MYIVIQIDLESGELRGYGPYGEKRNARTALEMYGSDQYHSEIVKLRSGKGTVSPTAHVVSESAPAS